MIHDGYTRRIFISTANGKWAFLYRPATRNERARFNHLIESVNDRRGTELIYSWVWTHIVETDWFGSMRSLDIESPESFEQLRRAIHGRVTDASGRLWAEDEVSWARNLRDGILFMRKHPELAARSCESCLKYWYLPNGKVLLRNSTNEPMLREGLAPCRTPNVGCPKGTPENQNGLNLANRWAFNHYMECKAIGSFPDDPIVRKNAVIISQALSETLK